MLSSSDRIFDTEEYSAAADIQMTVVYDEDVLSYPMVTHWDAEFSRGRRSL